MLSIKPNEVSTAKLHGYLLGSVAPRPIAFASTVDEEGNPNLAPFSFFNVFSANPPIMVFSPARSVRDNTTKHTLDNCIATKEVVVNVVNHDMVHQMSLASTAYPKGVNEFEKAGFTMLKSDEVTPFRVAESPVQFECKVNEVVALGENGGAGNMIVCEVVKVHINEAVLDEEGRIDQHKIDLVARAGGSFYSRAKEGFFEIPKPIATMGVGVDAIPDHIRNSKVLTGNDLGMLGNVEAIPSDEEVNTFIEQTQQRCSHILEATQEEMHKKAQDFLAKGEVVTAWKILLAK
ncbi:flavin reductase family protein [Pseudofulvibacter geojedonensis]|uniref:Flavin reductase family protein n=1 Tax=Pseudofulvibacter geojedonensis TaxID=1123758 RepID=A0ABW3I2A1_9FLAO